MIADGTKMGVVVLSGQRSDWLDQTIRSVFAQTLEDIELIVADSDQSGSTQDVCSRFGGRARRVDLDAEAPLPVRLTHALRLCHTRFVALVQPGDIMAPNNLELKIQLLEDHPRMVAAHSALQHYNEHGRIVRPWVGPPGGPADPTETGEEFIRRSMRSGRRIELPTAVLRRGALDEQGFLETEGRHYELGFWLRFARLGDIGFVSVPLVVRPAFAGDGVDPSHDSEDPLRLVATEYGVKRRFLDGFAAPSAVRARLARAARQAAREGMRRTVLDAADTSGGRLQRLREAVRQEPMLILHPGSAVGLLGRLLLGTSARRRAARARAILGRALLKGERFYVRYFPARFLKSWIIKHHLNKKLEPRRGRLIARARFGAAFLCGADPVSKHIYQLGIWEPNLTAWLRERLAKGDTFVDVGAHIGYYAILASRLVGPEGRVVAIEASPTNFREMCDNVARNRCGNVRAVNVAVWDRRERLRLFLGLGEYSWATSLVDNYPYVGDSVEIAAEPLSTILTSDEIRRARIIKIDIEGAELGAIRGLLPALADTRGDLEIVLEVSPKLLARQGKSTNEVLGPLAERGFHLYRIENLYQVDEFLRRLTKRPTRLDGPVLERSDLVLSRIDAEVL